MRLKRDGFVVLDSFLSGEELVRLQMASCTDQTANTAQSLCCCHEDIDEVAMSGLAQEAELVLEASGAYDADPCDPGGCGHPSMTATGSRCVVMHAHLLRCKLGACGHTHTP